ncbi:hypothetical protein Bca4012_039580 [Brassica carinata]
MRGCLFAATGGISPPFISFFPLIFVLTSSLLLICLSLWRMSFPDDEYAAGLGGCSALRWDYEVGKAVVSQEVGFFRVSE